jgi:hypothetical protein
MVLRRKLQMNFFECRKFQIGTPRLWQESPDRAVKKAAAELLKEDLKLKETFKLDARIRTPGRFQ